MGEIKLYDIIYPAISSAGVYYFTTDSGVKYEVRFGRRKDNILKATIVFGVINDEYEGEEYVETNRGEIFRVMNTIVKIVRAFMEEHPKIISFEFTGIAREGEDEEGSTGRINVYKRYLPRIFDNSWEWKVNASSAIVTKKNK